MSGRGSSPIKQGISALALAAAVATAPMTGGTSLAMIPGALAIGASGAKSASGQAKRAQNALQNNLLKPISKPQVMPTVDNEVVQQQRANTLTQLQQRSGRASTLLTNQFGG
jgi:hypothetical protein